MEMLSRAGEDAPSKSDPILAHDLHLGDTMPALQQAEASQNRAWIMSNGLNAAAPFLGQF